MIFLFLSSPRYHRDLRFCQAIQTIDHLVDQLVGGGPLLFEWQPALAHLIKNRLRVFLPFGLVGQARFEKVLRKERFIQARSSKIT